MPGGGRREEGAELSFKRAELQGRSSELGTGDETNNSSVAANEAGK